jgi:hypothetical protein
MSLFRFKLAFRIPGLATFLQFYGRDISFEVQSYLINRPLWLSSCCPRKRNKICHRIHITPLIEFCLESDNNLTHVFENHIWIKRPAGMKNSSSSGSNRPAVSEESQLLHSPFAD